MKKKLLVFVLALAMALGTGTAFADVTDDYDEFVDVNPVVSKTYEVNKGTAPAETFKFAFEGVNYKNTDGEVVAGATIPAINDAEIAFDAMGASATKTVDLDIDANDYELGVYTYKVTELDPAKATQGVTYSNKELYLVLTIIRDELNQKHYVAAMHYETLTGEKSGGFTNEYDAGTLAVTKQIEGNSADVGKKFKFTVTFAAQDAAHEFLSTIATDGIRDYTTSNNGLTFEFELGDDDTATFSNIPAGAKFTVVEDFENYTPSVDGGTVTGSIEANEDEAVTITNTKNNGVDTGVILDSMPFVAVIAVVAGAAVAFVALKRRSAQF